MTINCYSIIYAHEISFNHLKYIVEHMNVTYKILVADHILSNIYIP